MVEKNTPEQTWKALRMPVDKSCDTCVNHHDGGCHKYEIMLSPMEAIRCYNEFHMWEWNGEKEYS